MFTQPSINTNKNKVLSDQPSNTHLKKMCFQKCKNCKGPRCPNFYGHLGTRHDYKNYNGILHSKKIKFLDDIENTKIPMDNFDWYIVYFFICLVTFLTFTAGLLP